MDLRQLRNFLALVEHGNFNRAAQMLGITQQALSCSTSELEKSLQVRLFERTAKFTEVTEAGRALARRARLICGEANLARSEVSALRCGTEGTISFGVCAEIARRFLPDVIERFTSARPKVTLTVEVGVSSWLYERLLAAEVEFIVATPAFDPWRYDSLKQERLTGGYVLQSNFLVMRAGHPLLDLREPTLKDAVQYPWLLPATLPDFTRDMFSAFERAGASPPPRIVRTDSYWAGYSIIRQTNFVALTGREPAAAEIEAGGLAGFAVPELEPVRAAIIATREGSPIQPATSALMGLLRSVLTAPA